MSRRSRLTTFFGDPENLPEVLGQRSASIGLDGEDRDTVPVRVLSRVFRGKFVAGLRELLDAGKLNLPPSVADAAARVRWLATLYAKEWVVYAKPPFGGPEQVLKYLARYTHRVAISNAQLLELQDGRVTFRYKDYADDQRHKVMTLSAEEFLHRFVQHVLPKGFVKIRRLRLPGERPAGGATAAHVPAAAAGSQRGRGIATQGHGGHCTSRAALLRTLWQHSVGLPRVAGRRIRAGRCADGQFVRAGRLEADRQAANRAGRRARPQCEGRGRAEGVVGSLHRSSCGALQDPPAKKRDFSTRSGARTIVWPGKSEASSNSHSGGSAVSPTRI